MKHQLRRPYCWMFGCDLDLDRWACSRCGESLDVGFLPGLRFRIYWRVGHLLGRLRRAWRPRCEHCGKRVPAGWGGLLEGPYAIRFCSRACDDEWIPF